MKKTLLIILFLSTAAFASPGLPTYLQVGKLSCAARLITPVQLQIWCISNNLVIYNSIQDVTGSSDYTLSLGFFDPEIARVSWVFFATHNPINWQAVITIGTKEGPLLTGTLNPVQ